MAHGNELLKSKYFYLKLPKNWFKNARIKKLRKLAGGDTYTIIYLKLMLLSMNYNSTLIYEGIENTIEEELALKIDEEVEDVRLTVSYLASCGLWQEGKEGDVVLPEVNGMVGSETYGNILKKNKKLGLENCKPSANQMLTNKDIDIEIDIDKELEKDKEKDIEVEDEINKKEIVNKENENLVNDDEESVEDIDDDLPF